MEKLRNEIVRRLGYRTPYLYERLLEFFGFRALAGVEKVENGTYMRTAAIPFVGEFGEPELAEGLIWVENDEDDNCILLRMSEGLAPIVDEVAARVTRQFDLDSNPDEVAAGISSLDDVVPGAVVLGTRMPGCFDPFETTCRAILGQQVSVVAANKMAARVVESWGMRIGEECDGAAYGLIYAWPTAARILEIDKECPGGLEEAFGKLGVIGSRSRAILEVARMIVEGQLELSPFADAELQMERLVSIKGIGPWTANYIAMRTMAHADAFLETDVGVRKALPDLTPKQRLEAAEAWRPWRSYANISLWNSLS